MICTGRISNINNTDFKLHIFDMRAPLTSDATPGASHRRLGRDPGLSTRMPVRKVIQGHPGSWTITDANLSPDNERQVLAWSASYSTLTYLRKNDILFNRQFVALSMLAGFNHFQTPTVYMTSTAPDGNSTQIPIPFSDPASRRSPFYGYGEDFGIWSCRFSADGNEVVAGGNGKIFGQLLALNFSHNIHATNTVYDLLANKRTVKISAHTDDVNSCCWADTNSGNVLVSASDDTFLKVW